MKSSGKKQEFDTGAHRDSQDGKGRYDLLSPVAIERLARWYEQGAKKYGARNWEQGMPVTRCWDSAVRHLFKHMGGHRDEDHLAAALWNICAIIHIEDRAEVGELPLELVDWP